MKGGEEINLDSALDTVKKFASQVADFKNFVEKLGAYLTEKYPEWGWLFVIGWVVIWDSRLGDYLQSLS